MAARPYPARTRRAIGWYYTDATPAEKLAASRAAMIEAAAEMVTWGATLTEVEDAATKAVDAAEEEWYSAPRSNGR